VKAKKIVLAGVFATHKGNVDVQLMQMDFIANFKRKSNSWIANVTIIAILKEIAMILRVFANVSQVFKENLAKTQFVPKIAQIQAFAIIP
jgi:hypothetical protein